MFSRVLAISALAAAAAAQSFPSGLPPCAVGCLSEAAAAAAVSCASYTDTPCVCTSLGFQSAATQCLMKECSVEDEISAIGFYLAQCGADLVQP